jgi:hypothetical protein
MHSNLFKTIARRIRVTSDLKYDGSVTLKGVVGGKPYPVFWLDTFDGSKSHVIEDSLIDRPEIKHDKIVDFCEAYYKENSKYMYAPFMINKYGALTFGIMPPLYEGHLANLQSWYERECQRQDQVQQAVRGEAAPTTLTDPAEVAAPKDQLEDFVRKVTERSGTYPRTAGEQSEGGATTPW